MIGDLENNAPSSSAKKAIIETVIYESAEESGTIMQKKSNVTSAQMTVSKKQAKFNEKLQTTTSKKDLVQITPRKSEKGLRK